MTTAPLFIFDTRILGHEFGVTVFFGCSRICIDVEMFVIIRINQLALYLLLSVSVFSEVGLCWLHRDLSSPASVPAQFSVVAFRLLAPFARSLYGCMQVRPAMSIYGPDLLCLLQYTMIATTWVRRLTAVSAASAVSDARLGSHSRRTGRPPWRRLASGWP